MYKMRNRFLVLLAIIVSITIAVFFFRFRSLYSILETNVPGVDQTAEQQPTKTDFDNALPDGFPSDIPVEQGVVFSQSYQLDYSGQKQLAVVFQSAKTIEENRSLYDDFFIKNGWVISNRYDSDGISAFYAAKGNVELNVVVSGADAPKKSQVSLSVSISDTASVPAIQTTPDADAQKRSKDALAEMIKEHPEFKDALKPGTAVSPETVAAFLDEIGERNPGLKDVLQKAMSERQSSIETKQ